ncbi:ABC transporter substrate-binding protein [Nocardioides sp. YIM 152315]|uniref:ABC transporter substrate-binding protein n=1 Tax=Nocardioides sp. YIM 152315 TaxID=3031760 RepID=UPI0023DCC1E5|nr:ABC transporter substrate-binding protein [Nocardioides sp. YIM 152315]MDF1604695.1 ABC transporter substrate-binding protein [Nocardioides sp. YIM 152315]
MKRSRTSRLGALATAVAVVALSAGCGSDDPAEKTTPGAKERDYSEGILGAADAGDPVDGGTLSFGAYAEPSSLDPAVTITAGSTGGTEMAAIYDLLMRYDAGAKKYVPQLAESLKPNDDFSEWTLRLRDGVTFSDGTELDSAAVKWSQERYVAKPGPEAAVWTATVKDIATPDPLTVVYRLTSPWSTFPSVLSTGPGLIVAKSSDAGASFKPVGAGAFVLDKWAPQEELVLEARDDYWDGRPHLDKIRSVFLSDQQTNLDSLESGSIDMVFLRDPDKVDAMLDAGTGGYLNVPSASNVALINATEGAAGADPRVRQAMAYAVNPDLIRERAFDGHGLAGSTIFLDYSQWHGEAEGLPYDPEQAKKLVEEAKADGFDGKVHYVDGSDPASRATSLAVKASLEAVGLSVEIDLKRSIADQITAIAVNRDYDLAAWGLGYREGDPYSRMFSTLSTEGTSTYGMATSAEMDDLLTQLRGSSEHDDQVAITDDIQGLFNEQVPFLNWGPIAELTAWNDDVHGVLGAMNTMVLLDDAWVD